MHLRRVQRFWRCRACAAAPILSGGGSCTPWRSRPSLRPVTRSPVRAV